MVVGVVLNWNGYDDTTACLDSLERIDYENFETVVVDNGSEDGSGSRIEDNYPNVKVLFNRENQGFSGGMNTGIRFALEAGADYIFILNNDTIISEGQELIPRLTAPLIERSDVGITSPLIIEHGTDQVWFLEAEVDEQTLNARHIGEGEPAEILVGDRNEVQSNYVPLCAAMIDVELIEDVGLLNEQYFLYYEDIDFSRRARDKGYEFLTVTDARVEHKISQSTGDNLEPLNSYYAARNRILFWDEFGRDTPVVRFILGYLSWLILLTGNRLLHLRLQGLKALFQGVFDGVRLRSGRGPYPEL